MHKTSKNACLFLLLASTVLAAGGCASLRRAYHNYVMRGSIVEKSADEVVICIGAKEGAAVGQELEVVEFRQEPNKMSKGMHFEKYSVGKIRITEVFDEHFARARIVEGKAEKSDVVELGPRR